MFTDIDEVIRSEPKAHTPTARIGGRVSIEYTTEFLTGQREQGIAISPIIARLMLLLAVGLGVAVGLLVTESAAVANAVSDAGADLTRLLRAMAAIKTLLAVGATAAILWRFSVAVPPTWFAAYALACGAMAVGPGLIWTMAHVGIGALLLHGGLLAAILLLWRDPVTSRRLTAIVAVRRSRLV